MSRVGGPSSYLAGVEERASNHTNTVGEGGCGARVREADTVAEAGLCVRLTCMWRREGVKNE